MLSVVKCQLVIFVKVSYSKGLHGAGLLFLTFQLLVNLFEYIVNSISVPVFLFENWAGVLGYVLLGVLFFRKKKDTTDLILTVIGILLWIAQFLQTFEEFSDEVITAFIFCALGMLGVIIVLIALLFDVKAEHDNNGDK